MNEIIKHIIVVGFLLFLNNGQLFAHDFTSSAIQEQSFSNHAKVSSLFESYNLLFTVKQPVKEDFKKGTLTIDNEEEEIETISSKKIVEKSKLIFSVFSQLSTKTFQNITISLSLFNDIISHRSHNSLYLLFEVFRI